VSAATDHAERSNAVRPVLVSDVVEVRLRVVVVGLRVRIHGRFS
jgi:hypothetical protein